MPCLGKTTPRLRYPASPGKAESRRADAEAKREKQLAQLRALLTLRKLKEHASESAHQRRMEEYKNGAIHAIAHAVENQQETGGGGEFATRVSGPKGGLKSVAEIQEAEQQLREELQSMQAQNAGVLDKLGVVRHAIEGSEKKHDHHLRGKVRYLLGQAMEQ